MERNTIKIKCKKRNVEATVNSDYSTRAACPQSTPTSFLLKTLVLYPIFMNGLSQLQGQFQQGSFYRKILTDPALLVWKGQYLLTCSLCVQFTCYKQILNVTKNSHFQLYVRFLQLQCENSHCPHSAHRMHVRRKGSGNVSKVLCQILSPRSLNVSNYSDHSGQ